MAPRPRPTGVLTFGDDMDLVAGRRSVVRNDQAIVLRVEHEIERIAKSETKLRDCSISSDAKDFSAVPLRQLGDDAAVVFTDADVDRSVGRHRRVPTMMF